MHRRTRRLITLFSVAAASLAAAPAAHAGLLLEDAEGCVERTYEKPFTPWLDYANYVLAPGGRAESADEWTLNGASIVSGNEPWKVADPGDSRSLRIPGGASATTDTMCVGIDHPTLRFFARSSGTGLLSALYVDVLVEDHLGLISALPVGVVLPNSSWNPGVPNVVLASLLPLLPGEKTPVRWRFRAVGPGSWNVDDVYVDPYRTR